MTDRLRVRRPCRVRDRPGRTGKALQRLARPCTPICTSTSELNPQMPPGGQDITAQLINERHLRQVAASVA